MTGLLAYARALSLPGGGRRRLWLEVMGVIGAGTAFAQAGLPAALQAFGGAVLAHVAVAGAAGGVSGAARHPSALPTLPVTPGARIGATVLLSAPRMLPAAVVALAGGAAPDFVVGRLLAGIAMLATFLGAPRVVGTLAGAPRRATITLLLALTVLAFTTDSPLAPLLAGVVTMGLVAAVDRSPAIHPTASPSRYRPHPLDAGPRAHPLLTAARRDATRLGFRDGLVAGTAMVLLVASFSALLGDQPAGDFEELVAAARWGLREQAAWTFAFQTLSLGAIVVLARSVALPGHSTDPVARAGALAALRWLPISRADVWRGAAAVALAGIGAAWVGAMLPLGLGLLWGGGSGVLDVALLAFTLLISGLAAGLLHVQLGPLRAYEGGPNGLGGAAYVVPVVLLCAPTIAFAFTHMLDLLRHDGSGLVARAALLGAATLLLIMIAGRYRHLARA